MYIWPSLKSSLVLSLSVLLLAACAKETSKEEKRREETERQYQRIQKAEGLYRGYLTVGDDKIVPVALELTANRNPKEGADKPTLAASMRIGLFGGVMLSSGEASYDWGNGRLSVSLPKVKSGIEAGSGAPLELRATIADGVIKDAVLDGPSSGTHPVMLSKDGPNLFNEQALYSYDTSISDAADRSSPGTSAVLGLKRMPTPRAAPATSDMPLLPNLEASIRFNHLAVVAQTAGDVLYDPLEGYVDMRFNDHSVIRVDDVFLSKDVLSVGLEEWRPVTAREGLVINNAASYGVIRLGSTFPAANQSDATALQMLPPQYFTGTFQSDTAAGVFHRTIVSLEYQQTQGSNSAELPFSSFPKLRLRMLICSGTQKFREYTADLASLDQVKGRARFTVIAQNSANSILDIKYESGWQKVIGRFVRDSSGSADLSHPQVSIVPATVPVFNCESTAKVN